MDMIPFHECHIARHFLPAIVNDDWSGLDDDDTKALTEWLTTLGSICRKENLRITHYAFESIELGDNFTTCSICLQWADCVPVTIYAEKTGINY